MARSLKLACASALALCLIGAFARADELKDPTRPYNLTMGGNEDVEHIPVLQSVLISSSRKLAVIDGQVVHLNAKFGDQILVKISEAEVVLKRGRERQVLRLYPGLEKKKLSNARVQ